jgi:t-SNARE complex subunit (syntaxin)
MHSGQRNEAKRALQDIENKHKDVLRIEKSIIVWAKSL